MNKWRQKAGSVPLGLKGIDDKKNVTDLLKFLFIKIQDANIGRNLKDGILDILFEKLNVDRKEFARLVAQENRKTRKESTWIQQQFSMQDGVTFQPFNTKDMGPIVLVESEQPLHKTFESAENTILGHWFPKLISYRATAEKVLQQLRETAPAVLSSTIHLAKTDAKHDKALTKIDFDAWYKVLQIKPLLDLAKFALLGLSGLLDRPQMIAADASDCDEKLRSVSNLAIKAVAMPDFIHELTHFIIQEVFKNNYSPDGAKVVAHGPYAIDDLKNEEQFKKIVADLGSKHLTLDPILQEAFNFKNNQLYCDHSVLIARTAQMVVQYDDGLKRLQEQAPVLLQYYDNVFLKAVKLHTVLLQSRVIEKCQQVLRTQNTQVQGLISAPGLDAYLRTNHI